MNVYILTYNLTRYLLNYLQGLWNGLPIRAHGPTGVHVFFHDTEIQELLKKIVAELWAKKL